MYIKDTYSYSTSAYDEYNVSSAYIECLWVEIIRPNAKNLVICSVYRPPNGNVSSFCEKLIELTNDVNTNNNKEIFNEIT